MKKTISRFLALVSGAAMMSCCVPLEAFAAVSDNSQKSADLQPNNISFEQFSKQTQEMFGKYANEDGFFGEIELKEGESGVYINGEKITSYNLGSPVVQNGVLMADAGVFEIFDENAQIDIGEQGVTISTENGQATVDSQDCTYTESVLVPIADIALDFGYEVVESEDGVVLSNPFESARLIVKSSGEIDKLNAVDAVCGFMGLNILQFENALDACNAYDVYSNSDNIEFVTPSQMRSINTDNSVSALSAQTSEYYSWGAQVMAVDGFNSTLSQLGRDEEEVVVAVLDTGVDLDHSALSDRILQSGANFSSSAVTCAEDDQGHGTHVTGIICDLTLDNVKILPVKVLNSNGSGYDEMIFTGIIYAVESGADVINMSLGGFGTGDIYKEAFDYAKANGVVVCAAAGNDSIDTYRSVPASCDDVITVSAINEDLSFAEYSNFGSEVDFSAPGTNVLSTYIDNQYAYLSGTSMACPHASAAAAMLKSYDPALDADAIADILESSALDLGDAGRDDKFGNGLICFEGINVLPDKCAEPVFSIAGGEYENAVSVEISTGDANDKIYYTLDSSEPSADNGILYEGTIDISQSCVLKARAYCDGKYPSGTTGASYIISGADISDCFTVSDSGVITSYSGILSCISVPMQINGIEITAIGDNAFSDNDVIKSVVLPETVALIGNNAFADCTNLESLSADGVEIIGENAFADCAALMDISINSALTIGAYAFSGCAVLKNINMPNVYEISAGAFVNCTGLEGLQAESAASIGDNAFYNCSGLSSVEIDFENTESIGAYAFYMCSKLESPFVCENLSTLGEYSFYGCKNIQYVVLGSGITQIPANAFAGCRSLEFLGAANADILSDSSLCHIGEVLTDMDIENLETAQNALEGTTLLSYEKKVAGQFVSVESDALTICQNISALSFQTAESGTYYIEISGALMPEIEITSQNGDSIEASVFSQSACSVFYSVQLSQNQIYSIAVDSKTSRLFAVSVLGSIANKTDISEFDASYENGVPVVQNGDTVLNSSSDYVYEVTDNGVLIFGTGSYCGALCVYPATPQTMEEGEVYTLNSVYGTDEFAFVPAESRTYYFYALYDSENYVQYVKGGTGLTVAGKIYNSDHELLYTSSTSLVQDCYSYTYFYIEAYLEAGKTYYLSSMTTGNAGQYCVRITDTINLLFDTYVSMPATVVATGGEIIPEITIENLTDGTALTMGEDYLITITDNVNPGYANVYIYGLNDYYGVAVRTFIVTVEEADTTQIELSQTYTFDIEQGKYAAVSITFDEEATYRVTFDAQSSIKSYLKHISSGLSSQDTKNQFISLMRQGEYLLMFYPQDGSGAQVSVTIERLYSIADASVYVEDLDYIAGVTQIPEVTVRYGFTLLTEGVDYELSFVGNSPLPGIHYFGITGLGQYTGSATGSYNVDCSIKTSQAQTIAQGEHTVDITSAGSYKLFKFTADSDGAYLLSTRETANVALVVFDVYGNTVSANSAPMGFGSEFTMSENDVMYIAAMYYDGAQTGSWEFEITSDYVLLEDVSAVYDEYVPLNQGRTLPQVTLVDGDYTLQAGVDYEYFYAASCTNYGDATICYRGLGKYKFNKYVEYTIVMPIEKLDENAIALEADKPVLYEGDYYECGVYSFTASENAYYNMSQLAIIDKAFVQFYDENGKLLSQRKIGGGTDVSTRFFLKENETMYMLTGYMISQNEELYSGYLVKASLQTKTYTETYTENGITYTVFTSGAYAVVSSVDKDIKDVEILKYIDSCYAVTEINAFAFAGCSNIERLVIPDSVTEIGAHTFENVSAAKIYLPESIEIIGYKAFAQAQVSKLCTFAAQTEFITNSVSQLCTVYGYENTTAQSYCNENDIEYIILSLMLGDLDGDGEITAIDATMSVRIAVGILSVDPDMLGDVNGDGLYDAIDATIITRYAVGYIDKFPIE